MRKLILVLFILLSCASLANAGGIISFPGGGVPSAKNYTDDPNCQAAWLFADNLNDSSGQGNTLSTNGTWSYETTRPNSLTSGKSIHFDGSSGYLSIATGDQNAAFVGKQDKTDVAYCFWLYRDNDASAAESVFFIEDFRATVTYVSAWNQMEAYFSDTEFTNLEQLIDSDVEPATWLHYCVSFAGADPTSTTTRWISTESSFGDVYNGTTLDYTNIKDVDGSINTFYVGRNSTTLYLDGWIYQLIIFDRTISATEAEEMYTTGIDGGG